MQVAFGSSVLTHKKEQQIKIEGEFKPTVDCLCATRCGLVAVYNHNQEKNIQSVGKPYKAQIGSEPTETLVGLIFL